MPARQTPPLAQAPANTDVLSNAPAPLELIPTGFLGERLPGLQTSRASQTPRREHGRSRPLAGQDASRAHADIYAAQPARRARGRLSRVSPTVAPAVSRCTAMAEARRRLCTPLRATGRVLR